MNSLDLLILHGPPAAGKSSIARAMAGTLREHDIPHAVIEMDDLARIYPLSHIGIMYKNLAAIWPNYVALGAMKIIIPTYLQKGEYETVCAAAPAQRTTLCEVTAPTADLQARIVKRERDEATIQLLTNYLIGYPENRTPDQLVDFKVANFETTAEEVARDILMQVEWVRQDD